MLVTTWLHDSAAPPEIKYKLNAEEMDEQCHPYMFPLSKNQKFSGTSLAKFHLYLIGETAMWPYPFTR